MDVREWVQDNAFLQHGVHLPLCVKFANPCRRSSSGAERRRKKYKEKQQKKAEERRNNTALAERRHVREKPQVNGRENHYHVKHPLRQFGPRNPATHVPQAGELYCYICNSREHDRNTCPAELEKQRRNEERMAQAQGWTSGGWASNSSWTW